MEGNQMKMREALVGLAQAVREFMATKSANFYPDIAIALEAANAALAEPPRQCDVGTADEEYKRYSAFTSKWTPCSFNGHARCAVDCPVNKILERDGSGNLQCPFVWAQMPYTKRDENEEGNQI